MMLASQRFGASGMLQRDEIFSQINLRIAMKIGQAEVATLTEFQRAGKEAINALDGPGKVVINDRSGQDGYNVSGIISLLKGPARERFVQELAQRAGQQPGGARQPVVFEGLAQPRLLDNPRLAALAAFPTAPQPEDLERFVKRPVLEGGAGLAEWYAGEQSRIAWVGQEFNVRGYTTLVLKRKPGDNVVIVGSNPNARHGLLLSVLTSIALNLGPRHTEFALIDRTPRASPWARVASTWSEQLALPLGLSCRLATEPAASDELLRELEAELDARRALDDLARAERPSILLALLDADRLETLARKLDAYGGGQDSPAGARLRRLYTEGPQVGIHVLLSVGSGRALGGLIDLRKGLANFRCRLILQVSDDESFDLTGKRAAALLQADGELPICALFCDAETGAAVRFKPHVALPLESGDDTNPGVLGELPSLAGKVAGRNATPGSAGIRAGESVNSAL
jgi:S-DNA-T family DNA segregation ATPase FtsK/SpoIIIE